MAGHRNKDFDFVPWVGDRTGELLFQSPRVLPPFCVPVPCFLLLAHVFPIHLLACYKLARSYSATRKVHLVIRNLQSEVILVQN
ncbi:hypothetical protein PAHAL_9G542600 [Panicum hallii]|uniref:Uncharacterized protein n=1 Tax=Panicum hallii TaxID=206008 RepID=A0A2T8I5P3_9POAL|nr:hypothetical protein PAHAL_9G542600 [Panicum hallii]